MKDTTLAQLSVPGGELDESSGVVAEDDDASWTAFIAGDCVYRGRLAREPIDGTLENRIGAADISVVNFEAPIRGDGEPIPKIGPTLANEPRTPAMLYDAGFDVVTLANNHTMDYGVDGLHATLRACDKVGLTTIGAGESADEALEPETMTVGDGISLAIINLCEREFGVADESPGTAWISHPSAQRRVIEAVAEADVVVAVVHGGIEHVPFPPESHQRRLRSLVDLGVDAVIAHHPHVPQGWEMYEGAPICYSLGNFLFDSKRPENSWALAVELAFEDTTPVAVDLVPTELSDGMVRPLGSSGDRDPSACLDYLERSSAIVETNERLQRHWQELAVRMFDYRYTGWLRRGTASGPGQLLMDPRAAVGDETFDAERRESALLTLLNIIRNESHRDVIETALAVKTGDVEDRRTKLANREVRELLSWTESGNVYDSSRRDDVSQLVKSALARLR